MYRASVSGVWEAVIVRAELESLCVCMYYFLPVGSDGNSMDSVDSCLGLTNPDSLQNVQASSHPKKVDLIIWEIEVPKVRVVTFLYWILWEVKVPLMPGLKKVCKFDEQGWEAAGRPSDIGSNSPSCFASPPGSCVGCTQTPTSSAL